MDTGLPSRKLLSELHTDPARKAGPVLTNWPCEMGSCQGACQGRGIKLEMGGAYLEAGLCACVKDCRACLGTCLRTEAGKAGHCHEPTPIQTMNILNEAKIPGRYAAAELNHFRNTTGNGEVVLGKLKNYISGFDLHQSKGLILGGGVGVGKTYLLASMAKALALRGMTVRFIDFFQLLAEVRAAYADDRSDMNVLGPLLAVDVLIIDELGKGRNTDWELTVLDQLVMGRYNSRKTIIASTNYQLQTRASTLRSTYNIDLEREGRPTGGFVNDLNETLENRVGARIYSRLCELCEFLELTGDDFRKREPARNSPLR